MLAAVQAISFANNKPPDERIKTNRFTNEFRATNGSYFNTSSIGFKLGVFAEIPLKEKILLTYQTS